jgi:hypothetical protein
VHGGEHDLAGREEGRDLAVEVEDQAPEDIGRSPRRDGDNDGEALLFAAAGADF